MVKDLGFRICGLEFRVEGSGFRTLDSGFGGYPRGSTRPGGIHG